MPSCQHPRQLGPTVPVKLLQPAGISLPGWLENGILRSDHGTTFSDGDLSEGNWFRALNVEAAAVLSEVGIVDLLCRLAVRVADHPVSASGSPAARSGCAVLR